MRNLFDTRTLWTQHAEDVANMTAEQIESHTDHLDICPDCKHVRCSCGRCHSQRCNEICYHEVGRPAKEMMS